MYKLGIKGSFWCESSESLDYSWVIEIGKIVDMVYAHQVFGFVSVKSFEG